MPTFSYKGYDFEVAHQPTADEFAQMSAYVDTLPPKEAKAKVNPTEFVNELRQQGQEWGKGLQAGAETAASLLSGVGAMAGGPIASGLSQLTSTPFNVEHGISSLTYEPRTELGKELAGKAGEALSRYVVPAAVGVQGLPYANTLAPIAGALAGSLKRAGKPTPKAAAKTAPEPAKGVSTALDEIAGKPSEVAADPMAEFYKQQALDKQQQLIEQQRKVGEQPITVDTQGRASTLGATGPLETLSPMERMASDLGAEQFPENAPMDNSPMSRMVGQLVDETNTPIARAAQDALEARQLDLETAVKRQQALEATANERMKQEAAASVSEAHKAYMDAQNEARLAADSARMSKAEQMLIDDTQHVLPDSGELYASQYGVERGMGRVDENGMPIRADRSMEVQNLENPLQRNLWGDELPRQSSQESVRGITRAMDITPEGPLKNAQREALGAPAKLPPLGSTARKALMKKQGGGVKIDWNDRKKVGALENNPGLKNVLRDVGDSLIESPQEAVRLANQAPDVSQNIVQKAFNSLTKGGTYLKQRVNHPLVHYAVDRFQQANNMARAEISQKLNGVYLNDLRSLSKAEYQEVFELLNTADLNKKEITPEFLAKHGFSSAVSDFITTKSYLPFDLLF